MKRLIAALIMTLLASCGPLNEGSSQSVFLDQFQALAPNEQATAPSASQSIVSNAQPGEILLVSLLSRNAVAPMVRYGRNRSLETWISPGKVSMTFNNGILVSTRGLGDDLMGADVSGVLQSIRAGAGRATRQHSFLNSLDQIELRVLSCTITSQGMESTAMITGSQALLKVKESCSGDRLAFENTYWLRGSQIVKSRQVVSPGQGFIEVQAL